MKQKHLLVAASIIAMWLAVLFVGVFGPDIVNEDVAGDRQVIPVVSAVALFATIASAVVGWAGFRE
jgi:uncharacterized membrane-anchored protein